MANRIELTDLAKVMIRKYFGLKIRTVAQLAKMYKVSKATILEVVK